MKIIGLDIGSNSVGSAWIDTETQEISPAVSVFPAGVDESDEERGAPKNQARRQKRSQRRTLKRRSQRKRLTRQVLTDFALLPVDERESEETFQSDPWALRRSGLSSPLKPFEFGRALVHLGQHRGAVGFDADADDTGKVKKAMLHLQEEMLALYATPAMQEAVQTQRERIDALRGKRRPSNEEKAALEAAGDNLKDLCMQLLQDPHITFGRFMADSLDAQRHDLKDASGQQKLSQRGNPSHYHDPIRNRLSEFKFHAHRTMILDEFEKLWNRQAQPDGALSHLDEAEREQLRRALNDPDRELHDAIGGSKATRYKMTFRHGGALFGQRNTYWDTGTLGRCSLEPSDHCIPIADRHASWYRVLESVNNIRIKGPHDRQERPLTPEEREKVVHTLRSQKTASAASVRMALGIDKRSLKKQDLSDTDWILNIERDEDREINTDWFHFAIVLGVLGEPHWDAWPENLREGLNRALLKCDPATDGDDVRLAGIAAKLGLEPNVCEELVAAWKTRPKVEKRLKLSRRAIQHLTPYMQDAFCKNRESREDSMQWWWLREHAFDPALHHWPTQIEAREMYSVDPHSSANDQQRKRYKLGSALLNKAARQFASKHPGHLPPAPMLSNPVVRKAIHEVRRHIAAHIRDHGGARPDRIVIEFARETTKPKALNDRILQQNRKRERIRKQIADSFVKPAFGDEFYGLSNTQLQRAIDRVILAHQQREQCAYSGQTITKLAAAKGDGLEIDHIIPYSRCGNNSWSNLVLCRRDSNRDKGKLTPREWWKDAFEQRARVLAFMEKHVPAKDDAYAYFSPREYADKWKLFSAENVPEAWRGSQLTDTAYAARQVQEYLQHAVWPGEPSHLEGGTRRIFVTKGAYTHQLRSDWQLFQTLVEPGLHRDEVKKVTAKNRGDHREHAVDAVAIAFIGQPAVHFRRADGQPSTRIDDLAHFKQQELEARHNQAGKVRRNPLPPPWGTVKEFRRQVLSRIYAEFDDLGAHGGPDGRVQPEARPIVVCHRPVGRKLSGAFHEETLFGPLPEMEQTYIGRKPVLTLTPAHLRPEYPEPREDAIKRIAADFLKKEPKLGRKEATARATKVVDAPGFEPMTLSPGPAKSGLVRDPALRDRIRECISSFEYIVKDQDGRITARYFLDPDEFSPKELKQAVEAGAIRQESGVPIKRVKLLRIMKDPVIIPRKRWNSRELRWERDTGKAREMQADERSRADRAYVGGNNHHIEIREDSRGKWSGIVIPTYEVARVNAARLKALKDSGVPTGREWRRLSQPEQAQWRPIMQEINARFPLVDRSDNPEKGGRFVMSLSEGEMVFMNHKQTKVPGFFVVFKLEKPSTVHFKPHWDSRRATGEKELNGTIVPNSQREEFKVSASDLANMGVATPNTPAPETPRGRSESVEFKHAVKVRVDALGTWEPIYRD